MFISELIRAIIQIAVLSVIPVIWWLITAMKKESFFSWVGLKKPNITEKKKFVIFVCVALAVTVSMSLVLDPILPDDIQLANERFGGQGIKAFVPAIIFSFLQLLLPKKYYFAVLLENAYAESSDSLSVIYYKRFCSDCCMGRLCFRYSA